MIRPILKYFGGKYYLQKWIRSFFPAEKSYYTYIEPCIGGANVFLNKNRGHNEIIADINPAIVDVYKTIRDSCGELKRLLHSLPYSEPTFQFWKNYKPKGSIESAAKEIVIRRMSRAALGKDFAWSERLRGGLPGDLNAWQNAISNIHLISERLCGVEILLCDAVEVLKYHSGPGVFVFLDPPYLQSTIKTKNAYDFQVPDSWHIELIRAAVNSGAKFALCGYDSELYNDMLIGCKKHIKPMKTHSGQGKTKSIKNECLWVNYE